MKRCGKSAPRPWQHGWQAKPRTEQDQIGRQWSGDASCQAERKFLVEKLRENAWNISKTAEVIGTPRSNLYKKLEQYAISEEADG